MNGTIKVNAEDDGKEQALTVESHMEVVSPVDKLLIVHAVMQSMEFSPLEEHLLMAALKTNFWPDSISGVTRMKMDMSKLMKDK